MPKRFALGLILWVAAIQPGLTQALDQSTLLSYDAQASQAPQPSFAADDPQLLLIIRNAIIALNQANLTGNYSVLRDMGTPNFQQANTTARLAEVFATLRARKIDVSPIMFFTPKFSSPPAMQDGRVLRVSGVFPTTPEQVNFDLALQMLGEQWMIAAIAVTVTPPGEAPQANAASAPFPRTVEATDAKPIRIDLSQPGAGASRQQTGVPRKAASKKPKPPHQKTAAAQPGASSAAAAPHPQPDQDSIPAPSSAEPGTWPFER